MRAVAELVSGYKACLDDRYPRDTKRSQVLTDRFEPFA